ncbi:PepSY-like domain-containing protein [Maribacter ulvicola]|uniref:Putative beta-lactamase-inhibitor-like, PepSY-like n=1 Tax=Maribacter ulvicola TaxID=228959 RepID=A0A1N6PCE7_9FLAO|nr:PepSY-like domain-containing protein [Maribacter ulvicola]SIQ02040.1 Putative beta-lactamase-inhibitor-like, PepSY-like [Maribacter ulvicola]
MKNKSIATLTLTVLGIFTVFAQDIDPKNVPEKLKQHFEQNYPQANDVEWEMDGQSYKVEFDHNKQEHEIWYTADGNTTKTELEITEAELPSAITSVIASNYDGYKVDSVEKTTVNGTSTYDVELEKGWNNEKDIVFDENGKVLSEMVD